MGANVAAAFAMLGGAAALVTNVGDDERGGRSLADLRAFGVDVARVNTMRAPTFWTLGLLDGRGEKSLLEFRSDAFSPAWDRIDWSVLDGAGFAYTTCFEAEGALRLYAESRARGVPTALDLERVDDDQKERLAELVGATPTSSSARPAAARALAGVRSTPGPPMPSWREAPASWRSPWVGQAVRSSTRESLGSAFRATEWPSSTPPARATASPARSSMDSRLDGASGLAPSWRTSWRR